MMDSTAINEDSIVEMSDRRPILGEVQSLRFKDGYTVSYVSKVGSNNAAYRRYSMIGSKLPPQDLQASLFLPSFSLSYRDATRSMIQNYQSQLNSCQERINSSKSVLVSLAEKLSDDRGASVLLAMWNILPIGSSVFSLPYCVVIGGYAVIPIIFLMSILADVTGLILVDCLYAVSPKSKQRKRVHLNYVDIARTVWGEHGARVLHALLIFYLFSGCVVNILLLGKSVNELLQPYTHLSFELLTIIFSVLVYPTLFIRKLTVLAYLSMSAVISIIVSIIAGIVTFFIESGNWKLHAKEIPLIDINGFPLAVSIVMLTCVSHSVLPQIEGNLADSSQINRALHQSYLITAMVKFFFAIFGCVTFGLATQSIVTLNVAAVNQIVYIICAIALLFYAVLNYPLGMFVVSEFVDSFTENTKIERSKTLFFTWIAITRLVLITLSVIVAIYVPYFAIVLGIRGSVIATCFVFVFPCYFHLKLKWKTLSFRERFTDIILLFLGVIIGACGLYASIIKLIAILKLESN